MMLHSNQQWSRDWTAPEADELEC